MWLDSDNLTAFWQHCYEVSKLEPRLGHSLMLRLSPNPGRQPTSNDSRVQRYDHGEPMFAAKTIRALAHLGERNIPQCTLDLEEQRVLGVRRGITYHARYSSGQRRSIDAPPRLNMSTPFLLCRTPVVGEPQFVSRALCKSKICLVVSISVPFNKARVSQRNQA